MRLTSCAAVLALLAGCATVEVPSKLYDLQGGKVLQASFVWKGDQFGPATINTGSEVCSGEYRTIIQGQSGIGAGSAVGGWGAIFGTLYSSSTSEKAQKGVAIAICPSSLTFDCEYITNVSLFSVTGHGACKDNRGGSYRLMF